MRLVIQAFKGREIIAIIEGTVGVPEPEYYFELFRKRVATFGSLSIMQKNLKLPEVRQDDQFEYRLFAEWLCTQGDFRKIAFLMFRQEKQSGERRKE